MLKKRTLVLILSLLILGIFAGAVQAGSPAVVFNGQQLTLCTINRGWTHPGSPAGDL